MVTKLLKCYRVGDKFLVVIVAVYLLAPEMDRILLCSAA